MSVANKLRRGMQWIALKILILYYTHFFTLTLNYVVSYLKNKLFLNLI